MKLSSFVLGATLALAPISASAQVRFDAYADVVPGEAVASVDVFYDQLSPYGVWLDDHNYGQVFIPSQSDYVPYTNGHWEFTDVGLVWVSDEPFAWATSHYGRWFYSDYYGRWVWLPDTTWGPAWVEWYATDYDFGWAPLAPQIVIATGYRPPVAAFHFCPSAHITDFNVVRYYESPQRVVTIQREARPLRATATVANTNVVVGPSPTILRQRNVTVQKRSVQPRMLGRMSRTELQAAETRARARRPEIEQQNQHRLTTDPKLRDIQRKAATRSTERQGTPPRTQPLGSTPRQPPQPRVEQPRQPQQSQQPRVEQPTERSRVERPQPQQRVEPPRVERPQPQQRGEPPRVERPQPQQRVEPPRAQQPPQQQPQRQREQPAQHQQPRQAPTQQRGRDKAKK